MAFNRADTDTSIARRSITMHILPYLITSLNLSMSSESSNLMTYKFDDSIARTTLWPSNVIQFDIGISKPSMIDNEFRSVLLSVATNNPSSTPINSVFVDSAMGQYTLGSKIDIHQKHIIRTMDSINTMPHCDVKIIQLFNARITTHSNTMLHKTPLIAIALKDNVIMALTIINRDGIEIIHQAMNSDTGFFTKCGLGNVYMQESLSAIIELPIMSACE